MLFRSSNETSPQRDLRRAVPDLHRDLKGAICPFQAHIRRVNPRFRLSGVTVSNPLFRRSIPFQQGDETGLLFLAMQANIALTFGVMMQMWIQNPDFPVAGNGTDALIGSPDTPQAWPNGSADGSTRACNVGRHVQLQGGEFFFAPSMAFFAQLSPVS